MSALDDIRQRAVASAGYYGASIQSIPTDSIRDRARLLGALDAVLALHTEDLFRGHLSNGCRICGHDYPCATVRAINDALEASQ